MRKIRNIIFDLGGVILNIDLKRTELAFAELGVGNFKEYYTLQTATPLFEDLELGRITPKIFYDEFRKLAKLPLTDEEIRTAWNALLVDFPPERIDWLKNIKSKYNIFLLSNTNEIHHKTFTKMFEEEIRGGNFDDQFIRAYYSFRIGLRKPSKESYEAIMKNERLTAAETLFIDDSMQNIGGAASVGLQTCYLPSPHTITELDL